MRWRSRSHLVAGIAAMVVLLLIAGATVLVRRVPPAAVDERRPAPTVAGDSCARVRVTSWSPLPGVEYTGRLRVDLPPQPQGALVLFIGDHVPLDVEVHSVDGRPLRWHRRSIPPGPGLEIPPDFWLEAGNPWLTPGRIVRAAIDAHPSEVRPVVIDLGRRAPRVLARLRGYDDGAAAAVCAAALDAAALTGREALEIEASQRSYFASGWYGVERRGQAGPVRWMQEYGAVLVPSARGGPVHVRLLAAPGDDAPGDDGPLLSMRVNDVFDAGPQVLRRGIHVYEWRIPGVSWVIGTNELLFQVSRTSRPAEHGGTDRRRLGMALTKLTITPVE